MSEKSEGSRSMTRHEVLEREELPEGRVESVTGDGGFGQSLAELTTAVKYGMDIPHVLVKNSELAKISKEQRSGSWDAWETNLINPDSAAYAESCGALGLRVTRAEALDEVLGTALLHRGPSLIDVQTDPEFT